MGNMFFSLVRGLGLVVSLVALVAVIGGGVFAVQEFSSTQEKVQPPEVKFEEFQTYKNFSTQDQNTVKSPDILKKEKEQFHKDFEKYSAIAFSNLSNYAKSVNQNAVNAEDFEKYLFVLVSHYNADLKSSYLKQLANETKNLQAYGQQIKSGADVKVIQWANFLNWFANDFNAQIQDQLEKAKVNQNSTLTLKASLFTNLVIAALVFVTLMFFVMMLILIKIESNTRQTQDTNVQKSDETPTKEESIQEESKEEEASLEKTATNKE